jgi:DeoR/GlpR family transcriptional regulator of sugar metabolism
VVRVNDSRSDLPLDSREMANVAEKEAIARIALTQIQKGDTLFFDASSTVFHLARLLANLQVTVLTNGLKIAVELARRPAVEVVLIGGIVNHGSLSCQGTLTDQVLESYHLQKVFISCRGLDAQRGLSEANAEQAGLRQKIIKLSDQTIVLADHTKIGLKSSYFFAKLDDVDALITDRPPDKKVKRALQRGGGRLLAPQEQRT